MRTSPGESGQSRLQVADVSPLATGVVQVADAEVVVPSANFSDASVPVLLAALFQCVAGLTPADSVAPITTVPVAPESTATPPPTKSMLMIIGTIAASATAPPVPAPPVPPAPAPPEPPVASGATSTPTSRGEVVPATGPASAAIVPPAPPAAVPLVPPALVPPVAVPPVGRSTGRLVSVGTGTSTPPSRGAPATGPASCATFPPAPPVGVPLVPPGAAAVVPPATGNPPTPPVGVPPVATPPPEAPPAASGPTTTAPPLPALAAAPLPPVSPASLACPQGGCVRFTQAANRAVAATAANPTVKKRAKFVLRYKRA